MLLLEEVPSGNRKRPYTPEPLQTTMIPFVFVPRRVNNDPSNCVPNKLLSL